MAASPKYNKNIYSCINEYVSDYFNLNLKIQNRSNQVSSITVKATSPATGNK